MKKPLHALLAGLFVAVAAWSYVDPHDHFTWWLETIPAFVALALLVTVYRRFQFTDLVYGLIFVHCAVLFVGGHYTYAEVPLFNWIRDVLGTARNSYDGVGHFVQGFVPAMVIRELLLRTSPLKPGKWLVAIVIFSCTGISALYEIIEYAVAIGTGEGADAFLGTQGDIWDTQKDMALAFAGALVALIFLSKAHNHALEKR